MTAMQSFYLVKLKKCGELICCEIVICNVDRYSFE